MKNSLLSQTAIQSMIKETSVLAPQSQGATRSINAELLLTALIDAFSILVIFLLMSFSSTGDMLFINKDMELPQSSQGEIVDRAPVVKWDQGQLYLDETPIDANVLTEALLKLRQNYPVESFPGVVMIQADRRVKYESLNAIVVAASQAGYSDMRFAVLLR